MAKKETKIVDEVKFTKEQLIVSVRFSDNSDLLNALLEDGKQYSVSEVDGKINKYMKGKVD